MATSVPVMEFQFIIDRECESLNDSMVMIPFNDNAIVPGWPLDFYASAFEDKYNNVDGYEDEIRYTGIHNKDAEQIRVDIRTKCSTHTDPKKVWEHAVLRFEDVLSEAAYNRFYLSTTLQADEYRADLIRTLIKMSIKRISCQTTFIFEKSMVTIKKKEVEEECRTTAKK